MEPATNVNSAIHDVVPQDLKKKGGKPKKKKVLTIIKRKVLPPSSPKHKFYVTRPLEKGEEKVVKPSYIVTDPVYAANTPKLKKIVDLATKSADLAKSNNSDNINMNNNSNDSEKDKGGTGDTVSRLPSYISINSDTSQGTDGLEQVTSDISADHVPLPRNYSNASSFSMNTFLNCGQFDLSTNNNANFKGNVHNMPPVKMNMNMNMNIIYK